MEQIFFSDTNFNILYGVLQKRILAETKSDITKFPQFQEELKKIMKSVFLNRNTFNIPSTTNPIDVAKILTQKSLGVAQKYIVENINKLNNGPSSFSGLNRDVETRIPPQLIVMDRPISTTKLEESSTKKLEQMQMERAMTYKRPPQINFSENGLDENINLNAKFSELVKDREPKPNAFVSGISMGTVIEQNEVNRMSKDVGITLKEQPIVEKPSITNNGSDYGFFNGLDSANQTDKSLEQQFGLITNSEVIQAGSEKSLEGQFGIGPMGGDQFKSSVDEIIKARTHQTELFKKNTFVEKPVELSSISARTGEVINEVLDRTNQVERFTNREDKYDYNAPLGLIPPTNKPKAPGPFVEMGVNYTEMMPNELLPQGPPSVNVVTAGDNQILPFEVGSTPIVKLGSVGYLDRVEARPDNIDNIYRQHANPNVNTIEPITQAVPPTIVPPPYNELVPTLNGKLDEMYKTILNIPNLITRQDKQLLTIRTYNLIVNSGDRAFNNINNLEFNKYNFKLEFGTPSGSVNNLNPNILTVFKNVTSIKLRRLVVPQPADSNNYRPLAYILVVIDEFDGNVFTTKNFNENVLCKMHYDKTQIFGGGNYRNIIYYKNEDDDFKIFYPAPLAKLERLTLKLFTPWGQPLGEYWGDAIDDTFEATISLPNTLLITNANQYFDQGDNIILSNDPSYYYEVSAGPTAGSLQVTPNIKLSNGLQDGSTVRVLNQSAQISYIFEVKIEEPDNLNPVRPEILI
jgi:hypothetical protein